MNEVSKRNFVDTKAIRRKIIKLLYEAKASHLGSSMSLVEIVSTIYSLVDNDKIKKISR
jgi:transketolase N-terminal domain/subunit